MAAERKRHQAYLMVDRGTILGVPDALTNLPKQRLSRFRKLIHFVFMKYVHSTYRRALQIPYTIACMRPETDFDLVLEEC